MPKVLAVVSVLGKDQKGVVAQFATFLAERGVNIEDIEQRVVSGLFLMDMLVDLGDITTDLSAIITGLIDLGKKIDMDVRVHLHGQRRQKRVALLVSKEDHCLAKLLADHKAGLIHGEIACVLSNHESLRPLAEAAGLPFAWKGHDDLAGHFKWLGEQLEKFNVDLVVLARYMRILPAEIVQKFRFRVINIHPSLLPFFPARPPTGRRSTAAFASAAARRTSSPNNSTKARSFCRTSSTSTSAMTRSMT
ncbi:MAG: formyltransferase family protein [Tepidisphaeraceae bacterium]